MDEPPRVPQVVSFNRLLLIVTGALGGMPSRKMVEDLQELWRMGAPIPANKPAAIERRVLLPGQFRHWWRIAMEKYR